MDRKAVAKETMRIMEQGYYDCEGSRISIAESMRRSVDASSLITPAQGEALLAYFAGKEVSRKQVSKKQASSEQTIEEEVKETDIKVTEEVHMPDCRVQNLSTVEGIRLLTKEGLSSIGVLNFASAKNPGGGFLNGAMAQEESLAASGTLYKTLIAHEAYYQNNRRCPSMIYTDHAIYSPEVVFFRDGAFRLVSEPVTANVLTLPAVNMGQALLKGEDRQKVEQAMYRRMKLALTIFADRGDKNLVLGAYGCGVFRNDPRQIALWWRKLLEEGMGAYFDTVLYAVLDRSRDGACIRVFEQNGETA